MSTTPTPEFRSNQHEFTDEQNRTISQLAESMRTVGTLMKLLGVAFLVFFGLTLYRAILMKSNYEPAAGLGAATLLCLTIGLWTGGASKSFRRVVESKNEDVWHLMSALSLRNMFGLLRGIVMLSLMLLVVGLALAGTAVFFKEG